MMPSNFRAIIHWEEARGIASLQMGVARASQSTQDLKHPHFQARNPTGQGEACKASQVGSIPTRASSVPTTPSKSQEGNLAARQCASGLHDVRTGSPAINTPYKG